MEWKTYRKVGAPGRYKVRASPMPMRFKIDHTWFKKGDYLVEHDGDLLGFSKKIFEVEYAEVVS